jgi:hypothetical protein
MIQISIAISTSAFVDAFVEGTALSVSGRVARRRQGCSSFQLGTTAPGSSR